jgi:hypothetical protein
MKLEMYTSGIHRIFIENIYLIINHRLLEFGFTKTLNINLTGHFSRFIKDIYIWRNGIWLLSCKEMVSLYNLDGNYDEPM